MKFHRQNLSARSSRGFAMVATVLLTAVLSSIAVALIHQARSSTAGLDARSGLNAASAQVDEAVASLTATLDVQPLAFLDRVLPDEGVRTCSVGVFAGQDFEPGDEWPASCGTAWSYVARDDSFEGVELRIAAPSSDTGLLAVTGFARTAGGHQKETTYQFVNRGGAGVGLAVVNPSTGVTLDVSDLVGPSEQATVAPSLYASSLNTGNPVEAGAVLPEGLVADVGTGDVVALGDTRSAVGVLTGNVIAGAAHLVERIACDFDGVCLAAGGTVVNSAGTVVTVDPTFTAFAVVPDGNGIHIYGRTTPVDVTSTSALNASSNLAGLASVAGHPGAVSSWTPVAHVNYPSSGALYSDAQLTVGMCGTYTATSCVDQGGEIAGVRFREALSVAAPQLVIGSNIRADRSVGLVAKEDIVIPFWARPASLTVEAHLAAPGTAGTSGVWAFPADLTSAGSNWSPQLTISGTVTSVGFGAGGALCGAGAPAGYHLGLCGFEHVKVDVSQPAAPWFTPQGSAWRTFSR